MLICGLTIIVIARSDEGTHARLRRAMACHRTGHFEPDSLARKDESLVRPKIHNSLARLARGAWRPRAVMDFIKSIAIAATGMRAEAGRMRVIAENIANADSTASKPGGDPY